MLPIPISELWASYRSTTVAADASERDLDLAWSAFHGGIFALARVLAHMDANGDGDEALAAVRWISEQVSEARAAAPGSSSGGGDLQSRTGPGLGLYGKHWPFVAGSG